ncbi:MAG: hypothetical protein ACKOD5_09665, partial [Chthoniobacterales bacterium]
MTQRPASSQWPVALRLLLAAVAFAVVLAPWWLSRNAAREAFPGFELSSSSIPADAQPFFFSEEINPTSPEAKAHSGTLAELPDGSLAAGIPSGSGEGARDVTIQFAARGAEGKWSAPR